MVEATGSVFRGYDVRAAAAKELIGIMATSSEDF